MDSIFGNLDCGIAECQQWLNTRSISQNASKATSPCQIYAHPKRFARAEVQIRESRYNPSPQRFSTTMPLDFKVKVVDAQLFGRSSSRTIRLGR